VIDVYCHTSPSGGRYVGLARNGWRVRWNAHVCEARRGSPAAFHRAIRKYGPDAFTHEVLERMTTEAGAKRAEQLWIRELGTRAHGYNETDGGDGVHGLSERARLAIGDRHRGKVVSLKTRALMSAQRLGVRRGPHSAEHRARISAAHVGKKLSEVTREKLRQVNTGKKQTAETREKRAAALRGRKRTPEQCARISAAKIGQKYRRRS